MGLATALTRLATWAPAGVTTVYALGAAPAPVMAAALPALLIELGQSDRGLRPLDVGGAAGRVSVGVIHRLLVDGVAVGRPQDNPLAAVALVDAYLTAARADWDLNGSLLQPLEIQSVEFGLIVYGGAAYYGVSFFHRWVLAL